MSPTPPSRSTGASWPATSARPAGPDPGAALVLEGVTHDFGASRPPKAHGLGRFLRRAGRTLAEPTGLTIHPLAALEAVEGLDGRFDAVVYLVADDADHTGCLA